MSQLVTDWNRLDKRITLSHIESSPLIWSQPIKTCKDNMARVDPVYPRVRHSNE